MSQTRVVATVVAKAVLAKTTGLVPEKGSVHRSHTVTTRAVAIAEISLHALIRHQSPRLLPEPPATPNECPTAEPKSPPKQSPAAQWRGGRSKRSVCHPRRV